MDGEQRKQSPKAYGAAAYAAAKVWIPLGDANLKE